MNHLAFVIALALVAFILFTMGIITGPAYHWLYPVLTGWLASLAPLAGL